MHGVGRLCRAAPRRAAPGRARARQGHARDGTRSGGRAQDAPGRARDAPRTAPRPRNPQPWGNRHSCCHWPWRPGWAGGEITKGPALRAATVVQAVSPSPPTMLWGGPGPRDQRIGIAPGEPPILLWLLGLGGVRYGGFFDRKGRSLFTFCKENSHREKWRHFSKAEDFVRVGSVCGGQRESPLGEKGRHLSKAEDFAPGRVPGAPGRARRPCPHSSRPHGMGRILFPCLLAASILFPAAPMPRKDQFPVWIRAELLLPRPPERGIQNSYGRTPVAESMLVSGARRGGRKEQLMLPKARGFWRTPGVCANAKFPFAWRRVGDSRAVEGDVGTGAAGRGGL
eukprot:gene22240-biopygen7183